MAGCAHTKSFPRRYKVYRANLGRLGVVLFIGGRSFIYVAVNHAPYLESIPEGVDPVATPDEVAISLSWWNPSVWLLLIFVIFWDGLLFSFYRSALSGHMRSENHASAFPILFFSLGHVAVGVGLTYFVICSFFNRTVIRLTNQKISKEVGPLWWPQGTKTFSIPAPTSFKIRQGRSVNYRQSSTFKIIYVDPSNRERTLFFLQSEERAAYVCGYLNHAYGPPEPTARPG